MTKANQDIRQYMEDHGVSQKRLATEIGVSQMTICRKLNTELSPKDKEMYLNMIDAIVAERGLPQDENETEVDVVVDVDDILEEEPTSVEPEEVTCSTKFQIGDRVKIPSKANKTGTVSDIWSSLAKAMLMYAVENEDDGYVGMYCEDQLEPAPLPTDYSFEATIDTNVAVVTMIAKQGEKTWVYARGHAHILHDGEVGMAQAISFASKRMFESLDKKQDKQIYFRGVQG